MSSHVGWAQAQGWGRGAQDKLAGQHGGSGGPVARRVVGAASHLLNELRPRVLHRVRQHNGARDGDAVVDDLGQKKRGAPSAVGATMCFLVEAPPEPSDRSQEPPAGWKYWTHERSAPPPRCGRPATVDGAPPSRAGPQAVGAGRGQTEGARLRHTELLFQHHVAACKAQERGMKRRFLENEDTGAGCRHSAHRAAPASPPPRQQAYRCRAECPGATPGRIPGHIAACGQVPSRRPRREISAASKSGCKEAAAVARGGAREGGGPTMSFASARVTTAFRRDTRARPDRGAAAGRSAVACGQRAAGLGERGTKR